MSSAVGQAPQAGEKLGLVPCGRQCSSSSPSLLSRGCRALGARLYLEDLLTPLLWVTVETKRLGGRGFLSLQGSAVWFHVEVTVLENDLSLYSQRPCQEQRDPHALRCRGRSILCGMDRPVTCHLMRLGQDRPCG